MEIRWPVVGAFVASMVSVLAGVAGLHQYLETRTIGTLTGPWILEHTVESGPFSGMRLKFKIYLTQNGRQFAGTGEKWAVNNTILPENVRTPLSIVAGTIDGSDVSATYVEQGTKRETRGVVTWKLNGNELRGNFAHSTGSSGTSVALREK